eukprot:Stramenopile-MAST_4_protein_2112
MQGLHGDPTTPLPVASVANQLPVQGRSAALSLDEIPPMLPTVPPPVPLPNSSVAATDTVVAQPLPGSGKTSTLATPASVNVWTTVSTVSTAQKHADNFPAAQRPAASSVSSVNGERPTSTSVAAGKKPKKVKKQKIKIKLQIPKKANNGETQQPGELTMLEFVYDLANDTPEGLAKEIYASRDDLEILMTEETYNKVIDKIRRSVDQVVNTKKTGRQSVVQQPGSNHGSFASAVPSTRGVSSGSTLGGLEAIVDGMDLAGGHSGPTQYDPQTDPEWLQARKKYEEDLQKLHDESDRRRHNKAVATLSDCDASLAGVIEASEKQREKIDKWGLTYSKSLGEKVEATDLLRSTRAQEGMATRQQSALPSQQSALPRQQSAPE